MRFDTADGAPARRRARTNARTLTLVITPVALAVCALGAAAAIGSWAGRSPARTTTERARTNKGSRLEFSGPAARRSPAPAIPGVNVATVKKSVSRAMNIQLSGPDDAQSWAVGQTRDPLTGTKVTVTMSTVDKVVVTDFTCDFVKDGVTGDPFLLRTAADCVALVLPSGQVEAVTRWIMDNGGALVVDEVRHEDFAAIRMTLSRFGNVFLVTVSGVPTPSPRN